MLMELQKAGGTKAIPDLIRRVKAKEAGVRLVGFGHRVYKNYDPRAKILRGICREVLEEAGLDLSRLSPAFCARTVFERPIAEGFLLEESFEYAIELPRSFSPYAVDGEVSAFAAFTAEETLELIEANRMMPEAAAAALRILQKAAAENASALSAV